MCGIIGYIGPRNASEIVVEGLKKLEYRGYDSFGFAVRANPNIKILKRVGKIGSVTVQELGLPESNLAIGHTRWATHGSVTEINTHPHTSQDEKIIVIHNGIIENFLAQKKFLESQGMVFYSQTDTEIIPKTIEYHMKRGYDFVEACKRSLTHLEGQYAIVALHKDENKLVAIRKEAPLVIGVGEGEFFVASDVPAFLEYTKKVIFLDEMDLAVIDKNISVFNLTKNSFVERAITNIDWNAEQARKGEFDHFFMKEVYEQANTLERVANIDESLIKEVAEEIRNAEGIFFVACGTASYACMHGVYTFAKIAKMHINFCLAHEFPNFKHFLNNKSLVIALSQSGETADTLTAIRAAKAAGAKTISITNAMGSSLMRESDKTILARAGPEICVLSTKAYTSQLAILTLLA
ncbi:MAG: glutamine--fructose-6-phosphate transaminase (isomerizing), partial [DPANN group archaeon]|nr:glutamine--fructose-6-phosphate transaminase (isomerizing) [DPANN group archaeon]